MSVEPVRLIAASLHGLDVVDGGRTLRLTADPELHAAQQQRSLRFCETELAPATFAAAVAALTTSPTDGGAR